jgi:hypothetical protein
LVEKFQNALTLSQNRLSNSKARFGPTRLSSLRTWSQNQKSVNSLGQSSVKFHKTEQIGGNLAPEGKSHKIHGMKRDFSKKTSDSKKTD